MYGPNESPIANLKSQYCADSGPFVKRQAFFSANDSKNRHKAGQKSKIAITYSAGKPAQFYYDMEL